MGSKKLTFFNFPTPQSRKENENYTTNEFVSIKFQLRSKSILRALSYSWCSFQSFRRFSSRRWDKLSLKKDTLICFAFWWTSETGQNLQHINMSMLIFEFRTCIIARAGLGAKTVSSSCWQDECFFILSFNQCTISELTVFIYQKIVPVFFFPV